MDGTPESVKVGDPLSVGLSLGWLDGRIDTDGLEDGIKVGQELIEGTLDSLKVGDPLSVGLSLGCLDGRVDTDG